MGAELRSANEISAMVLKAARGAGVPLGAAEDLARAAPFLAAMGAVQEVAAVLAEPVEAPAALGGQRVGGHPVLAIISALDLRAAGFDVRVDGARDALEAALERARASAPPPGPFEVAGEVWADLAIYADKTFVPETDASRLGGAGAGLTDND